MAVEGSFFAQRKRSRRLAVTAALLVVVELAFLAVARTTSARGAVLSSGWWWLAAGLVIVGLSLSGADVERRRIAADEADHAERAIIDWATGATGGPAVVWLLRQVSPPAPEAMWSRPGAAPRLDRGQLDVWGDIADERRAACLTAAQQAAARRSASRRGAARAQQGRTGTS